MSYTGPIIDSDIHHRWVTPRDILPYLSERTRDFVTAGPKMFPIMPPGLTVPHTNGVNKRLDSYSDEGHPPGSHLPTLQKQLFAESGVTRGVLSYDVTHVAGIRNSPLSVELCTAVNEWSKEHWLDHDDRLRGAILVPTANPAAGAEEIHRLGNDPRMAEVIVVDNPLARPFGDPIYHDIYRAAAEYDLPIAIHVAGDSMGYAQSNAGGVPGNRLEFHTTLPQAPVTHLTSFITHGVFERFPNLRLLLVECGISWAPWLMTSLDQHERLLRLESPWVKRTPSDYIRDHVLLTTQPLEATAETDHLLQWFDAVGGFEDLLCFSSDYPHWDFDEPSHIVDHLPEAWHEKILFRNAARAYGWDPAELIAEAVDATPVGAR